jgi:hypothetical protein
MNDTHNISTAITGNVTRGGGGGRQNNRGGHGGRGRGKGRNTYLGSYSPEQWRKLSKEKKQKVFDGRNKSAEQRAQQNLGAAVRFKNGNTNRGIASVVMQQGEADNQSQLTGFASNMLMNPSNISTVQSNNMGPSILQGTLNGSAAVGDKRTNADSAGSFMSRRRINTCVTSQRKSTIALVNRSRPEYEWKVIHGTCELDSHADTSVAGPNCVILEYTDQVVNVSAFSEHLDTMDDIAIVTAATAVDDPKTGITTILVLGQALYMGEKVRSTLLCPNQMRVYGILVDDTPVPLAPMSKPSTHSIHSEEDNFFIPLKMKGVFSYFDSHTPTQDELATCRRIHLTDEYHWDPHSNDFQDQENHIMEHNIGDYNITPEQRQIMSIKTWELSNISTAFDDRIMISSANTTKRHYQTAAEHLANIWNIGLQAAKKTIQVTTQKGTRTINNPIEQRFRTRMAQLRYNQLGGRHGRFYTDTFFSSVPTLNGNTMAQIYTNDLAFTRIYPMRLESQTHETLSSFIHEIGIPSSLHSDNAKELMQGRFKDLCKEYHIPCSYTEPHSPWQNRAENAIRELKRHVRRKMAANKVPHRLWDFCIKWSSDVRNKTSSNRFVLDGRTPYEAVLGHTPDISSISTFNFYEPIWYLEQTEEFPKPRRMLGRWLGEAYNIGQALCYWVLPMSGTPIARSTVQQIPNEHFDIDSVKEELKALDKVLQEKFGNPITHDEELPEYDINDPNREDEVDDGITPLYEPTEPEAAMPNADEWDSESFDKYISAQVILPSLGSEILGTVTARKRDVHGNPIGVANNNPILNTRIYEVTFPDGHTAEFAANVIAECLYSQIDSEG